MKLFSDLSELKKQRQCELELLHTRIMTIANAVEGEPARWVGAHPYVAMAGAAAVGFIAAQRPARPPQPAAVPAKEPAPSHPLPPSPSGRAQIVEFLIDLALQFLQPPSAARHDAPGPVLVRADAGTISSASFPRGFGPTTASGPDGAPPSAPKT